MPLRIIGAQRCHPEPEGWVRAQPLSDYPNFVWVMRSREVRPQLLDGFLCEKVVRVLLQVAGWDDRNACSRSHCIAFSSFSA